MITKLFTISTPKIIAFASKASRANGRKGMQVSCIFSFSQSQPNHLSQYQHYLTKHNESLKKPHTKLQSQQKRIIQQYLSQGRYPQIIHFIANNTNHRLCHINTASTIDKALAKQMHQLTDKQIILAAYGLVSFREGKVFGYFRKGVEKKIKENKDIEKIGLEQLIVYLYGQLINHKNIGFLSDIMPQPKNLQILHQYLSLTPYRGTFSSQLSLLLHYLQLILEPSLNSLKTHTVTSYIKKKSLLEIDVESFLKVMRLKHRNEAIVNNYSVDFIVQVGNGKEILLQVNGNYHYTLNGKLKGKQIVRNLIVEQFLPLRIVHHQDYLLSKGHRNKIAYLQSLLDSRQCNWECSHKGVNSGWQVSEVEPYLQQ